MGENLLRNEIFYRLFQKIRLSLHLKNHQNFKGEMDLIQEIIDEAKKKNEQKENLSNRNSVFDSVFSESVFNDYKNYF